MKIYKMLTSDLKHIFKDGIKAKHQKGEFNAYFYNRLLNVDEITHTSTTIIALKTDSDFVGVGDELEINSVIYEVFKKEIFAEVNNRFYLKEQMKLKKASE